MFQKRYIPVFDPKEKFFKFYEKIEDYRFGLHIVLYNGNSGAHLGC